MEPKKQNKILPALSILCILLLIGTAFFAGMYLSANQKLDQLLVQEPTTPEETTSSDAPKTPASSVSFFVNGEPLTIDLNSSEVYYNVLTLNTEFETTITTSDTEHSIQINGEPMEQGESKLSLPAINKTTKITLDIDKRRFYIRTFPDDFPTYTALGESSKDGFFYTVMGNYITKFDNTGNIVFYRKGNGANLSPFRREEIDGEIMYSYMEYYSSLHHESLSGAAYRTAALILLNEHYEKIDEVASMAATDSVPEYFPPENHEYIVLGKNHYVLLAYVGKKVTNIPEDVPGSELGANVVACVFQEIKDGECIFEWDSTDYPELYELSLESCDYTNTVSIWADYAHVNAISIDPRDNNFLCSVRNLDSILKIDRQTGEIIWCLGGGADDFGITEEQQFHRQHNISITEDGYYTMLDNGCLVNVLKYPYQTEQEKALLDSQQRSRILKIKLDEENKTITEFHEFYVENFYNPSMGSVQVLDNDTNTILIGWGTKGREGMPFLQEINFNENKVNFEILFQDTTQSNYRVNYYEN